jgi:hypothetical protein
MAGGLGAVAMGGTIAGIGTYDAWASGREDWRRARESTHMARILATAQEGPFGRGQRPYGMGPNFGSHSGMTLALHYARNGTGIRSGFLLG